MFGLRRKKYIHIVWIISSQENTLVETLWGAFTSVEKARAACDKNRIWDNEQYHVEIRTYEVNYDRTA